MMMHFKNRLKLIGHSSLLVVLIAVGSMAPVTAQGTDDMAQSAVRFCAGLATTQSNISNRMAKAQVALRQSWQTQNERLDIMTAQQSADMTKLQGEIDAARQRNLSRLQLEHARSADRAAITIYQQTVKQTVTTRRNAVTQAHATFEHAVRDNIASRQAARAGQAEAFRIAVDDALRAAKVACQEDPESTTAQAMLSAQLYKSRAVFKNSLQTDVTTKQQIKNFASQRNDTIRQANQTFTQQLTAARSALDAALKTE